MQRSTESEAVRNGRRTAEFHQGVKARSSDAIEHVRPVVIPPGAEQPRHLVWSALQCRGERRHRIGHRACEELLDPVRHGAASIDPRHLK